MIRELKQICSQNLTREKLILVPTLSAGQQLLQTAVQAGVACLNLKVETVLGLCLKALKPYMYQQKLRLISSLVSEYFCLQVLRTLAQTGELRYFNRLEITAGVVKAITSALMDIKMAGLSPADLGEELLLDSRKGADLKLVLAGYEAKLKEHGCLDRADVLRLGAARLETAPGALYLVPSCLELQPLERMVVERLPSLELQGGQGLGAGLDMFQAYGESNEVREVVRRVKGLGTPLDQVAILCTVTEPYTQLLYAVSQNFNLPLTFGGGVELRNSRTGRCAYELLEGMAAGEASLRSFGQQYLEQVENLEVGQPLDVEAKQAVGGQLRELLPVLSEEVVSCADAAALIKGVLAGCRIGKALPRPGHIHVDKYEQGLWLQRPQTYIVGLDGGRFPGQASEDPILLDVERVRLGNLELKRLATKRKQALMEQVLTALPGHVTLSYACFDTVNNKELFPAAVLLQQFRRQTGDDSKDYGALLASLGPAKGFVPQTEALDSNEWCMQNPAPRLWEHFPLLNQGWNAWSARLGPELSEYDGLVSVAAEVTDPRRNGSLILSSSQLEQLGKCPFGYFLKYILGVLPQEEPQRVGWLEPATRGILLHGVFEQFFQALQGERPQLGLHLDLIQALAQKALVAQRELVPPPNETVYEEECKEILESCRVFLTSEEAGDGEPVEFELAFGPVSVSLPDGQAVQLRGKIDRVDRVGDGTYRVVDYKTGSAYGYEEQAYYQGGRQIQHALYAVAFEALRQVKVSEAGYVFPSVKGEGKRLMREQGRRDKFYELLGRMLDLLAAGKFVMTDKEEDCRYCDYSLACNRQLFSKALAEKSEAIRGLREYE